MGNEQRKSKYKSYDYNYSSSSYNKRDDDDKDDENEQNSENNLIKENDINSDTEYSFSICQKIIKALNQMNLSSDEVKENFGFYKNNFAKLFKINKIITNIKYADLSHLSPHDILIKLIPESKILNRNLNNPDYGPLEIKTKELLNDYEILPEYILPPTWEELFKLQCHDTAIEKLFVQSEIERVIKQYADLNQESVDNWNFRIVKAN